MAQIKWAQVTDPLTKECSIGLGNDANYYKSIGFEQLEVEEAWDGAWYLKGYAPSKPQSVINQEIIAKDQAFLNETDWYVTRYAETGKEVPANILKERARCREEISSLRNELGE